MTQSEIKREIRRLEEMKDFEIEVLIEKCIWINKRISYYKEMLKESRNDRRNSK